jgi:hypothetical protein
MDENDMFGDPARVQNADESGLQLNNGPQKVVSMKGKKNVMSVTAKERIVTVVACVSATGVFIPPYVIFKGKNLRQEFRDGMPPGTAVSISKSGYITIEIFHDFIKHFVSHNLKGISRIFCFMMATPCTKAIPILCSTLWITTSL